MSQSRRCDRFLATDGKWYLILGDDEYCYDDHECTTFGPFDSNEDIDAKHLQHVPNTGCESIDDSGIEAPPKDIEPPCRPNFFGSRFRR